MARKTSRFRYVYARPSFLGGMARILDSGGTLNEYDIPYLDDLREGRAPSFGSPGADAEAIREVWTEVGQHIYGAIGRFEAVEKNDLKSEG